MEGTTHCPKRGKGQGLRFWGRRDQKTLATIGGKRKKRAKRWPNTRGRKIKGSYLGGGKMGARVAKKAEKGRIKKGTGPFEGRGEKKEKIEKGGSTWGGLMGYEAKRI